MECEYVRIFKNCDGAERDTLFSALMAILRVGKLQSIDFLCSELLLNIEVQNFTAWLSSQIITSITRLWNAKDENCRLTIRALDKKEIR